MVYSAGAGASRFVRRLNAAKAERPGRVSRRVVAGVWKSKTNQPPLVPPLRRDNAASCSAGCVEQARNGTVDLFVAAFAVMLEHAFSALIDNVLRGPILIAIGVPG